MLAANGIADIVENHRAGSCTVVLQIPFTHSESKREVKSVTIGPFTLGQRRAFQRGDYKDWFALFCDCCYDLKGELLGSAILDQLRMPDDERVMAMFWSIMPQEISEAKVADMWPGGEPKKPSPADSPDYAGIPMNDPDDDTAPQQDAMNLDA